MSPDPSEDRRPTLNQSRLDFLKAEFELCSTFLDLAETRIKAGNQESAETAIANAEKGYEAREQTLD